jgi:hypothetical protein
MKTRIEILAAASLIAFGPAALAAPVPGLSRFFRDQLANVPSALQACELAQGSDTESWRLDTFFLDVAPYVGIGVPSVFELQVVPEIEFVFSAGDAPN